MQRLYTMGFLDVAPEQEDDFVKAWTEFATWASTQPGAGAIRLTRDARAPGRYVSLGLWNDAEAVRTWKSKPEFKQRLGRMRQLTTSFEPTELFTLVKVEDGTAAAQPLPRDLEPIHAP